jgi:hypothetical protein
LYQAKRAGRNCVVAYDPKRAVADFDEEAEKRILGVG